MSKIEQGIENGFHPFGSEVMETYNLKMIRYPGSYRDGSADGIAVYKFFTEEQVVIYSGLTTEGKSTINAAEEIVKIIKDLEKITDENLVRFFDVQTSRGYDYYPLFCFDVTEVHLDHDGCARFKPHVDHSELPSGFFI